MFLQIRKKNYLKSLASNVFPIQKMTSSQHAVIRPNISEGRIKRILSIPFTDFDYIYNMERIAIVENEVEAKLSTIKDMKTNLTEINKTSDKVKSLLDDLRTSIRESLKDLNGYIAECES